MSMQFTKDPDATLDYSVDWTKWLAGDSIVASQWSVPPSLVQVSANHTSTKATVWLSGGATGQSYTVTNRITTAGGRTDERSIIIRVQER